MANLMNLLRIFTPCTTMGCTLPFGHPGKCNAREI